MIRCDRCEFFFAYEPAERPEQMIFTADAIYGGGECRRHPPINDEPHFRTRIAQFPIVPLDYWCGEFQIQVSRIATERTKLAQVGVRQST